MAVNFKMSTTRKDNKRMIIRMSGDFDGTSAWELVHKLQEEAGNFDVVELDTRGIKNLVPFGRQTFLVQAAPLKKMKKTLLVSGPYADDLVGSDPVRPGRPVKADV